MGALSIRPPELGDRETIDWIVASTGAFTSDEAEYAFSLVDRAMNGLENDAGDLAYVLEDGGLPVGFICFGPTPRTEGTWSLHAIAVERSGQRTGYGRHLLAFAEAEARVRGGRLMLAEAPPPAGPNSPRSFFERTGYEVVARIPGFYRKGSDKMIYAKELESMRRH